MTIAPWTFQILGNLLDDTYQEIFFIKGCLQSEAMLGCHHRASTMTHDKTRKKKKKKKKKKKNTHTQ